MPGNTTYNLTIDGKPFGPYEPRIALAIRDTVSALGHEVYLTVNHIGPVRPITHMPPDDAVWTCEEIIRRAG